jgi:23S rRNA pseudouridine2605 synthase
LATTARNNARKGRVSLDRALSKLGLASRKEANGLILAGRVRVDNRLVCDPSAQVVPERVAIAIDGKPRAGVNKRILIMLHKPRSVVTTRSDPEGRQTVYDLIADLPARVIPVGRLDYATSGLLLFTNDTQLSHWLTDPVTAIERVYLVTVRGKADNIDDERVLVRKVSGRESHLVVTLTEGKNREVRNLVAGFGYSVTQLRRVQFGGLELGNLEPGTWRVIEDAEFAAAFPAYAKASARQAPAYKSRAVPIPK